MTYNKTKKNGQQQQQKYINKDTNLKSTLTKTYISKTLT